jgi:hypothetical protein
MYSLGIRGYFRAWIHYRLEFGLLLIAIAGCLCDYVHVFRSRSITRRTPILIQCLFIIQIGRLIEHLDVEFLTRSHAAVRRLPFSL